MTSSIFKKYISMVLRESVIKSTLGKVDSAEHLRSALGALPRDVLASLQKEINKINNEHEQKYANMETLFHGTTTKIADKIKDEGFKLTMGQRSGMFGATETTQNLAIFLSNSKSLAMAFGSNRDEYEGRETEVIKVKADIYNPLNMKKWGRQIPLEIRKIAMSMLQDYEGHTIRRPSQEDMFWFIDQPDIVNAIKALGFDSVVFSESTATKKSLGLGKADGDTYAVFDTSKLHIAEKKIQGLKGLLKYINEPI